MSSPVYSDVLTKSPEALEHSMLPDAIAADERAAQDAIQAIEVTSVYMASPASELTPYSDYNPPSIDANPSADSIDGHNSNDGWTVSNA